MQYDTDFREHRHLSTLLHAIRETVSKPIRIMEVCGGQTHALSRYRIEELLPDCMEMIHGPGCPVCVTPETTVSQAVQLAHNKQVILCTFGDMMRVPGKSGSLLQAKAQGGDVRMLYSPLDTLRIARENPQKEVIFFAVGFETTAPLYALLLQQITTHRTPNLSLLTSLFTIPSAIEFLASDPNCRIDALLAAGHVCSITGTTDYTRLAQTLHIPIAVTGFEPADLLYGIYQVSQLKNANDFRTVNAYCRAVPTEGNPIARQAINRYFTNCNAHWRGLGEIPQSGLRLRPEYEQYDARIRFSYKQKSDDCATLCRVGEIMRGKITPRQCPLFGNRCTPDTPLGAAMVSSEGVCSAFYRYRTY